MRLQLGLHPRPGELTALFQTPLPVSGTARHRSPTRSSAIDLPITCYFQTGSTAVLGLFENGVRWPKHNCGTQLWIFEFQVSQFGYQSGNGPLSPEAAIPYTVPSDCDIRVWAIRVRTSLCV